MSHDRFRPHPDVRSTVYQIGVREGDQSDWEFVRDKYLTEIVASEKRTLMRAMAATENVKLIDIMLNEMAVDDTVILTQGIGFISLPVPYRLFPVRVREN